MPFKDILLALPSYPDPVPVMVMDDAVDLAVALEARISAIACEVTRRVPRSIFGDALINVSALVAAEHAKSAATANSLLKAFEEAARKHRVFHEAILEKCLSTEVPDILIDHARFRDLTIMPMVEGDYSSRLSAEWCAQSLIFGSGHPMVILPGVRRHTAPFALNTVVVAWDSGRSAARATADAIPILKAAKRTRIVTVTNEKPIGSKRSGADLAKHLASHGIDATLDEVDAAGRNIGNVLQAYVASYNADLLVMGAYGHSRIREFVLGGATKSMLTQPPTPIFLSH